MQPRASRRVQELYKRIGEYLELQERVIVLNNRFEVLTELLNIVREHENNLHIARLVRSRPRGSSGSPAYAVAAAYSFRRRG